MDMLSDLSRRAEQLRSQIREEPDKVLRKEMLKTYKTYNKEIRRAARPTSIEGKFLVLVFFLLLFVAGSIFGLGWMQHAYGWAFTVTSVLLTIGALVILTAMVFLLLKIISPEVYKHLVQTGLNALHSVRQVTSNAGSDDTYSAKAPPSELPSALPALPAPNVSFEEGRDGDPGEPPS